MNIADYAKKMSIFLAAKSSRSVQPESLQFGLHLLIEFFIKLIIWVLLGVLIQSWLEWTLIFCAFAIVRAVVGGVHANRFLVCVIWTEFLLVGTWLIWHLYQSASDSMPVTIRLWLITALLLIFTFSLFVSGIPVHIGKRKRTKRRVVLSRVLFGGLFMICLSMLWDPVFWNDVFVIGVMMAITASSPWLNRLFKHFDNIMRGGGQR